MPLFYNQLGKIKNLTLVACEVAAITARDIFKDRFGEAMQFPHSASSKNGPLQKGFNFIRIHLNRHPFYFSASQAIVFVFDPE